MESEEAAEAELGILNEVSEELSSHEDSEEHPIMVRFYFMVNAYVG